MGMAGILIGLLTAIFVYHDAKRGGHRTVTALLWAFGSTIMPILIVPLYLLLGRKTKQQDKYYDNDVIDIEATVVEETINCTRCGSKIKDDFVVCPYCQAPIAPHKKDN